MRLQATTSTGMLKNPFVTLPNKAKILTKWLSSHVLVKYGHQLDTGMELETALIQKRTCTTDEKSTTRRLVIVKFEKLKRMVNSTWLQHTKSERWASKLKK